MPGIFRAEIPYGTWGRLPGRLGALLRICVLAAASKHPDQSPLPVGIAVDVAFRRLDRGMAGEELHVAQAAAGAMDVAGRRRDESAPP
jgi:hypothetical protein